MVLRSAQRLYLHVQDQRARRGPQHEYKEDYEWLVEECKRYQLAKAGEKWPRRKLDLDDLVSLQPLPVFNAASHSGVAPGDA